MSRHQYIRNLDYQDALDEYEGYSEEEEDDELSPEDRALMSQGTADVQAALGVEASKVTVAQIEEALWHYYYDVDKTVAYLTAKFINPRPKATKPAAQKPDGKFATPPINTAATALPAERGIPVYWAGGYLDSMDAAPSPPGVVPQMSTTLGQMSEHPPSSGPPSATAPFASRRSLSYLFRDMPWGNIPKHRETTFIPPPIPRGGLLGGSDAPPKMSKLQALAAARKKKAEEKSAAQDKVEQTRTKMTELSVGDTPVKKKTVPLAGAFGKRLKTSESTAQGRVPLTASEPKRSEPSQPPDEAVQELEDVPTIDKAQRSAFAETLFASLSDACSPKWQESYSLYADLPASVLEAFSQPSPDDVVLAAQAKGSLLRKSKR